MAVVIMLGLILVAAVMAAMRRAFHHEPGVNLLSHTRKFLDEGHGRPQLVIAVIAPGRHACHLDPVFEDPEELRRGVVVGCVGEIGGLRVEAMRDVAFGDPRCSVANGAVCCKMFRADQKLSGIVEPRWQLDAHGVKIDGARASSVRPSAWRANLGRWRRRRKDPNR